MDEKLVSGQVLSTGGRPYYAESSIQGKSSDWLRPPMKVGRTPKNQVLFSIATGCCVTRRPHNDRRWEPIPARDRQPHVCCIPPIPLFSLLLAYLHVSFLVIKSHVGALYSTSLFFGERSLTCTMNMGRFHTAFSVAVPVFGRTSSSSLLLLVCSSSVASETKRDVVRHVVMWNTFLVLSARAR